MTTAVRTRRQVKVAAKSISRVVARLSTRHEYQVIRASLVNHWLNRNPIAHRLFLQCHAIRQLLNSHDAREIDGICETLTRDLGRINLKELECGFESLLGVQRRQSQGAVYTPNFIVDYLVENALSMISCDTSKITLCDPACGSGGFLIRAAIHLSKTCDKPLAEILEKHVTGFDNDSLAVENARCLIELFLAQHGQHLDSHSLKIFHTDSLLEETENLLKSSSCASGFDVVTTNPPYVKLQNLSTEYREQLVTRYQEYTKGSFSLAPLFLIAGHRLLATNGCLAYITQNNLFTSLAGQPIRRYLQDRKCVRRIVDFGHAKVFDNASAYTCLLFLGNDQDERFEFDSVQAPVTRRTLKQASFSNINVTRLDPKKWRLAKGRHLQNLQRIENKGCPLGEVAQIRVGFATLRDSVFFVKVSDEGCLAESQNGVIVPIERDCTRPAVKVADIGDESRITRNLTRIIFPYRKTANGFQVIPENDLRKRFPLTYKHLNNWRHLLDARDKGKPNPDGWYAWGRSQGREAAGPKLLTKTFDTRPNFMLDHSDQLFCNGYSVSLNVEPIGAKNLSIQLLARILNSRVMHYYAKLTSFHIEGGFQCYQKNFIERFGIPKLSLDESEEFLNLSNLEANEMLASIYAIPWDDIVQYVPV